MSSNKQNIFTTLAGVVLGSIAVFLVTLYERSQWQQIAYDVPPARPPSPPAPPAPEPIIIRPANAEIPFQIEMCVICQKSMRSSQTIKQLHCNHKLHMLCFRNYIKSNETTCPICRSNI